MPKKNLIWILLLALILIGVGFFFFQSPRTLKQEEVKQQLPPVSGTGAYDAKGNPVPVTPLPIGKASLPPAPDMSGPIVFPSGYHPEDKITVIEKIESLRKILADNPANVAAWVELGSYWKLIEDFKKAESAWKYAAEIDTVNPVPLGNLGFLYGYYIHDNAKAEEYYLEALQRGPDQIYLYFQIAEFYRDVLKNITKAKQILDQGIAKNPSDTSLRKFKETLK